MVKRLEHGRVAGAADGSEGKWAGLWGMQSCNHHATLGRKFVHEFDDSDWLYTQVEDNEICRCQQTSNVMKHFSDFSDNWAASSGHARDARDRVCPGDGDRKCQSGTEL